MENIEVKVLRRFLTKIFGNLVKRVKLGHFNDRKPMTTLFRLRTRLQIDLNQFLEKKIFAPKMMLNFFTTLFTAFTTLPNGP